MEIKENCEMHMKFNSNVLRLEHHIRQCKQKIKTCCYYMNPVNLLSWLNSFCSEFLPVVCHVQDFCKQMDDDFVLEFEERISIISGTLLQIVVCIRMLEQIIRRIEGHNEIPPLSFGHFINRISTSMKNLMMAYKELLYHMPLNTSRNSLVKRASFMDAVHLVLDRLVHYRNFTPHHKELYDFHPTMLIDNIPELCKRVRLLTLHYGNVALNEDKRALSALSEIVMRDCTALGKLMMGERINCSEVKLRASSLENAIHNVQDFVHESHLRLVVYCFAGFHKFSIQRVRKAIMSKDPAVDGLIADFDVNLDRAIQLGEFAAQFAPNAKSKAVLYSAVTSLRSLDSFLITAFQAATGGDELLSQALEEHFVEEVNILQESIHSIINSHALASCFLEILDTIIQKNDKNFDVQSLLDIILMDKVLQKHFQLPVNYEACQANAETRKSFDDYRKMLHECEAVINYMDLVENSRILKRFRMLRSMLAKFVNKLPAAPNSEDNDIDQRGTQIDEETETIHSNNGISLGSTIGPDRPTKGHQSVKDPVGLWDNDSSPFEEENHSSTEEVLPDFSDFKCLQFTNLQNISRSTIFKWHQEQQLNISEGGTSFADSLQISDIIQQLEELSKNMIINC